jgi:hypothetical protein
MYLITNALSAIDKTFVDYETQHPEDNDRLVRWRRARSQLTDQFAGVTGKTTSSKFTNPTMNKMTPVITDILRALG